MPILPFCLGKCRFHLGFSLVAKEPSSNVDDNQLAQVIRQATAFRGHIAVTDGIHWNIYHQGAEAPNLHFDLRDISPFWNLLTIEQANQRRQSPKTE